jgi:predicted kinase
VPRIVLITGVMAAGKSTVAQALAERLPRSVHVRGDHFRRSIVNGREEMTRNPTPEAVRQLRLRYELGTLVARRYHEAGFDVVYQDMILGEDLAFVVHLLRDLPLQAVILCPSPAIVTEWEATRDKTGYGDDWTVEELDASLRNDTPRIGYWLDTSDLTVAQTVDRILAHLRASSVESGRIGGAL